MQEDNLWESFRLFDVDNSGRITSAELRGILSQQGNTLFTDEMWNRIIAKFDTDHDGKVNFDEFCAMMQEERALSAT